MEILVIIGLILLLLVLWIISVQRKFAVMDGNIQNAMNQIGVQISSRFDALFAVLDLMKGYAADDIQPLMERAAARRSVITARSAPEEVSEQEQVIEETVKSIRLAAERNPLLCADKNYTKCMDAVECLGIYQPFDLQRFSDKVKQCAWYVSYKCNCRYSWLS